MSDSCLQQQWKEAGDHLEFNGQEDGSDRLDCFAQALL